ncbi:hypothetical protein EDB84DRAFT_1159148, partial [Lactarius hengduanensis]
MAHENGRARLMRAQGDRGPCRATRGEAGTVRPRAPLSAPGGGSAFPFYPCPRRPVGWERAACLRTTPFRADRVARTWGKGRGREGTGSGVPSAPPSVRRGWREREGQGPGATGRAAATVVWLRAPSFRANGWCGPWGRERRRRLRPPPFRANWGGADSGKGRGRGRQGEGRRGHGGRRGGGVVVHPTSARTGWRGQGNREAAGCLRVPPSARTRRGQRAIVRLLPPQTGEPGATGRGGGGMLSCHHPSARTRRHGQGRGERPGRRGEEGRRRALGR